VLQDAVTDHPNVSACSQKLHDFRAFTGHFCPTGFGLRILFQGAKVNAIHLKINLCEAMFRGSANGERRFADRYDFFLFHERLVPHRDEGVVDGGGGVGSSHRNSLRREAKRPCRAHVDGSLSVGLDVNRTLLSGSGCEAC
jgi:hypothetical protein